MRLPSPPFLVAEWDEARRVLEVRYPERVVLDEAMADETLRWLDQVVAEKAPGMALLVDAGNVGDATPAYRQKLGGWFRAHAPHMRMAVYDLSPFVRVMALLFARATRVPVKFASTREEALRWLLPVLAQ